MSPYPLVNRRNKRIDIHIYEVLKWYKSLANCLLSLTQRMQCTGIGHTISYEFTYTLRSIHVMKACPELQTNISRTFED